MPLVCRIQKEPTAGMRKDDQHRNRKNLSLPPFFQGCPKTEEFKRWYRYSTNEDAKLAADDMANATEDEKYTINIGFLTNTIRTFISETTDVKQTALSKTMQLLNVETHQHMHGIWKTRCRLRFNTEDM